MNFPFTTVFGQNKLESPWNSEASIREELFSVERLEQHAESLERMGFDYVDIYMMHRDNLDVPVGEFVDAMNRCVKAGTMKRWPFIKKI